MPAQHRQRFIPRVSAYVAKAAPIHCLQSKDTEAREGLVARGWLRAASRICMGLLLVALAGCGGGGGGGGSSSPPSDGVSLSVTAPSQVTMVEGQSADWLLINGRIQYGKGVNQFYVIVEGNERLLLDLTVAGNGEYLTLYVKFVENLAPGDYATSLTVRACSDEQCTRELGPSVQVPMRLQVLPNIQVQSHVAFSRSGREAAPSVTLPVGIPAAAGTVNFVVEQGTSGMTVTFDSTALHIVTDQVPAGTYAAVIRLYSSTDARYTRTVRIEYTVAPPTGGEQALHIEPPYLNVSIPQGSRSVQQLRVKRPTWTDSWVEPQLSGTNRDMASLRTLDSDTYEVTIDTAGRPPGHYDFAVNFDAGRTGGQGSVIFSVSVEHLFSIASGLETSDITSASTASDLDKAIHITMLDGSTRRWTANSSSAFVRIANASGQTGLDALRLSIDPAVLDLPQWVISLPITLSVDVPGATAQTYELTLVNRITRLRRPAPSTIVGSSARVYVQGLYSDYFADPDWRSMLQVSGATLDRADLSLDQRFFGSQAVMALDLSHLVVGQPVVVRINSALAPSQVQFSVQAPFAVSSVSYQSLPFDRYRPGQYSPGLGSLYFAGTDTAYRWSYSAGSWALSQSSTPGLIDVAPAPDEGVVYATTEKSMLALNPQTLAIQSSGNTGSSTYSTWSGFDTAAPRGLNGLRFAADGRAMGSLVFSQYGVIHGVEWICSSGAAETGTALLTVNLDDCDPGINWTEVDTAQGFGVTRSVNGHAVVATGANGTLARYQATRRAWEKLDSLPVGVNIVAVSDDGSRAIRSDGGLVLGTSVVGSMNSVLPVGYLPGGYGLSAAGRYGLVYGYRTTGSGSDERASDAAVWIVDLLNPYAGISTAPVVGTVVLPQAVGCTSSFTIGETCAHQVSITAAPGQRTAFVLGPRGVAAVPLPSDIAEVQALKSTVRALKAAQPREGPARLLQRGVRRAGPAN